MGNLDNGFLQHNLAPQFGILAPHQRKLCTKHWFILNWSMQLLLGIPKMTSRQKWWRSVRGLQPGGPAGNGEIREASAIC